MIMFYFRGVSFVEYCEAYAIEADKPLFSPQPEISIPGLGNRQNTVLRQTIFRSPHVVAVLGNGFPGIQSERRSIPEKRELERNYSQARTVANQSMSRHRVSPAILIQDPVH